MKEKLEDQLYEREGRLQQLGQNFEIMQKENNSMKLLVEESADLASEA